MLEWGHLDLHLGPAIFTKTENLAKLFNSVEYLTHCCIMSTKWVNRGKYFKSIRHIETTIKVLAIIITRRRQWHPTPVLLPGKSHGRRSLVGCSSWGCEESDMTERLHFHFSLFCIGEGNGNPLQCSCLDNPRDRGAWWAAVYGVAQSQTRLMWLSSSSSNTLGSQASCP